MKVFRETLAVGTRKRSELVEVTVDVAGLLSDKGVKEGRVTVFVPHTTAGVTINEHADPSVATDIVTFLDGAVPWEGPWRHGEGNSAAHVKATLTGSSVTVMVEKGGLRLGTWQGIFFCEFDGPRQRKLHVTVESFDEVTG